MSYPQSCPTSIPFYGFTAPQQLVIRRAIPLPPCCPQDARYSPGKAAYVVRQHVGEGALFEHLLAVWIHQGVIIGGHHVASVKGVVEVVTEEYIFPPAQAAGADALALVANRPEGELTAGLSELRFIARVCAWALAAGMTVEDVILVGARRAQGWWSCRAHHLLPTKAMLRLLVVSWLLVGVLAPERPVETPLAAEPCAWMEELPEAALAPAALGCEAHTP